MDDPGYNSTGSAASKEVEDGGDRRRRSKDKDRR